MYRFDLESGRLKLFYNDEEIKSPEAYEFDTDPSGKPMIRHLPTTLINGKNITGWIAVLKRGGGGRKYGGFSLFQEKRQIQGFPNAWKPKSIFGGVDDEGANNLIAQRLMGQIELDSNFQVSHTKDAILFEDDEEEQLEKLLSDFSKDYRTYAMKRRGPKGSPWSRDKVRDLLESMKKEFSSGEMKDTIANSVLPPLDTIVKNNQQQLASVKKEENIAQIEVLPDLKVVVSLQEKSEYEPHLTIVAGAEINTIHVILNALHPYYCALESSDSMEECIRQYIYDAIAEYRVTKLTGRLNPDSVRRLKNDLLRVQVVRIENAAATLREGALDVSVDSPKDGEK